MTSSNRPTEKWINRGLWLISVIFAGFLIGLGSLLVKDLPKIQKDSQLEDFVDKVRYTDLKNAIKDKESLLTKARQERDVQNRKVGFLNSDYSKAKEIFNNWVITRRSTEDGLQNPEIVIRTKNLEALQASILEEDKKLRASDKRASDLSDELKKNQFELSIQEASAREKLEKEVRWIQLKVFSLRLALTLPLLLIAAWLFVKKRKTQHWPFVWGFVFFSLFAFFVELVPYLPSYGGYVRYIVGIILTYFIGRYSIKGLQRYLENQKNVEAQPQNLNKEKMNYDLAHQRLSRSICPGCERSVDLKDTNRNYCVHCGTCLFNVCSKCSTRKNAFAKFCHSCGSSN